MHPTTRAQLKTEFPALFPAVPLRFTAAFGWTILLRRLCAALQQVSTSTRAVSTFALVGEKFGALRLQLSAPYANGDVSAKYDLVFKSRREDRGNAKGLNATVYDVAYHAIGESRALCARCGDWGRIASQPSEMGNVPVWCRECIDLVNVEVEGNGQRWEWVQTRY